MKKFLVFIGSLIFVLTIIFGFMFFSNKNRAKGALQVTSKQKSNVYLEGKLIGQTPLCKCEGQDMLEEGEYQLKVVPLVGSFQPFENKIKITKSVLTVVDRTFAPGVASDGSIISLNPLENAKSMELLVISFPDGAEVLLDNTTSGNTPLLLKNLTESDHEVKIIKNGYVDKSVRIRTVAGYKLTVLGFLGVNQDALKPIPDQVTLQASPSAEIAKTKVVILNTPTGYLRVREDSSLAGAEIARVYPGESYELLDEKAGWFKIKLKEQEGWISQQYAKKQ